MALPQILKERFSEKDFNKHNDYIFELIKNTKSFIKEKHKINFYINNFINRIRIHI